MVWDRVWHIYLKRPYKLKKVVDQGNGPVNIVLIHGLASRSQIWKPLLKLLDKDKYRVRSFDLLGFGISPKPRHLEYSTRDHARTIMHSLRKDSGRNEQFIFIGHSMGCIIATHIAYLWPERVKATILYKPPLLLDSAERRSLHKKFYEYLATKPSTLALFARFINKFTDKVAGFRTDDEYWLPIANSLHNTILAQETLKELKAIQKPTDIIYGRFDFLASKVKARKLAQINPEVRLHYVSEMHDVKPKSSRYLKKLIDDLSAPSKQIILG
ncbi:MAG TPA: alpha/beta fold hydrolase [Candidatus Saccharimonadales bacterium]|nr:alpha/beta fold hydrolase [Candidatus Saccharimonadales bacterium]